MSKEKDEQFMRLALDHAMAALRNGWIPVGSVFILDERVITHGAKNGLHHHLFDHAEHNGCYQALWSRSGPRDLSGFTVYTTLEPCLMCLSMLMTTRVRRVVYAFPDPHGGGCSILENPSFLPARFRNTNKRPIVKGGVLRDESRELLRQFFAKTLTSRMKKNWNNPDNALVKSVMNGA